MLLIWLSILEERFGNPFLVTQKIVNSLRYGKCVRTASEVSSLADQLANGVLILTGLGKLNELSTEQALMDISARFPQFMQNKWVGKYHTTQRKKNRTPNISDMSTFYSDLASDFACPTFGEGY